MIVIPIERYSYILETPTERLYSYCQNPNERFTYIVVIPTISLVHIYEQKDIHSSSHPLKETLTLFFFQQKDCIHIVTKSQWKDSLTMSFFQQKDCSYCYKIPLTETLTLFFFQQKDCIHIVTIPLKDQMSLFQQKDAIHVVKIPLKETLTLCIFLQKDCIHAVFKIPLKETLTLFFFLQKDCIHIVTIPLKEALTRIFQRKESSRYSCRHRTRFCLPAARVCCCTWNGGLLEDLGVLRLCYGCDWPTGRH